MAFDLTQITNEIRVRAPRIAVLGGEKAGKSTFAAGSESPIFLPVKGEEGVDDIPVAKTPTCNTVSDIINWLCSLGQEKHEYQTVVIDSISTLEPIIYGELCEEHKAGSINEGALAFGVGIDKANMIWRQLTEILDALRTHRGMASILIGHIIVKRFDDPNGQSYDQYQWDIHHKTASLLYRWADSILFCNTKVVVMEEKLGFSKKNVKKRGIELDPGSRWLYTQKRPAHPGGGRGVYGRLPYELPLGWDYFRDAVAAAMKQ